MLFADIEVGYAPEPIEYGINRYQNETRRLYGVLDKHLADSKTSYLVGDKCTIADIVCLLPPSPKSK